jgi:hypothetical protein
MTWQLWTTAARRRSDRFVCTGLHDAVSGKSTDDGARAPPSVQWHPPPRRMAHHMRLISLSWHQAAAGGKHRPAIPAPGRTPQPRAHPRPPCSWPDAQHPQRTGPGTTAVTDLRHRNQPPLLDRRSRALPQGERAAAPRLPRARPRCGPSVCESMTQDSAIGRYTGVA